MSMIVAHEWYKETERRMELDTMRNYEADAEEAFAEDEKIYE
jgi:hypothetical protein